MSRKEVYEQLEYELDRDWKAYTKSEKWNEGHRDVLTEMKEFSENWYKEKLVDLIMIVKREVKK